MKSLRFLLFTASSLLAAGPANAAPPDEACQTFNSEYPDLTFFPTDPAYIEENENYYTSGAQLGPACIFAPTSAEEMSNAVKLLVELETPFAVRGGGHMPINNAANIDSSGVLLATSGLSQLEVSSDQSTVSVGPGNTWGDVYEYLEPFGLSAVGGRLGVVGVPGLVLGGGVSFFGNEHGWASDKVALFECVLSNGDVVEATADGEYSDLFWALKGGGNSFAIVTKFDLMTLATPAVYVGQASWGDSVKEEFISGVHNFAVDGGTDSAAAIIPLARWISGTESPEYSGMLFYDGEDPNPRAFENFTEPAMPPHNSSFSQRSMHQWTLESDVGMDLIKGMRQRFSVASIVSSEEAIRVIHDTYFEAAKAQLADVTLFISGVAFMPMAKRFFEAGKETGGNPMDVDASRAPYIWVEFSMTWPSPADDAVVEEFSKSVNAEINANLEALGDDVVSPFLYLNDADETQPVFEGYPPENLQRLKEIREKYDPERIYTDLMPGGWKVADV